MQEAFLLFVIFVATAATFLASSEAIVVAGIAAELAADAAAEAEIYGAEEREGEENEAEEERREEEEQ